MTKSVNDAHIEHIIDAVDRALEDLECKNIGIKFGKDIYETLVERNMISDHQFGVLGSDFLAGPLPADKKQWPAHIDQSTDGWGFTVGIPR